MKLLATAARHSWQSDALQQTKITGADLIVTN
jgi:hypothetical protein